MAPLVKVLVFAPLLQLASSTVNASCPHGQGSLNDEISLIQTRQSIASTSVHKTGDSETPKMEREAPQEVGKVVSHYLKRLSNQIKNTMQGHADEPMEDEVELDSEQSVKEEFEEKDSTGDKLEGKSDRSGQNPMPFLDAIAKITGQGGGMPSMDNGQLLADAQHSTTCQMHVDNSMSRFVSCQFETTTDNHEFDCEMLRSGMMMALSMFDMQQPQIKGVPPVTLSDKVGVGCENCWSGALPNCLRVTAPEQSMMALATVVDESDIPLIQMFWSHVNWKGPKPW